MKKLVMLICAAAFLFSVSASAEEKAPTAKPVKQPRVVEQKISEADMAKITSHIDRSIKEAVIAKQGAGGFEYMAMKMKPPKNDKWTAKWNDLGSQGWEAIDHFENVYIFKRPALTVYKPAVDEAAMKKKAEQEEKAKKEEEDKAKKEQEKATKKADKEAKAQQKKADKEAKKAVKEAEKSAEKTE